ncbi:MAG: hypothetical protein ACRDE2_05230 [Chitinophagaceae bacterium]
MKNMVRVRYLLLTLLFGVFAVVQSSAQMKIGNHPTQIQPASILELESGNQALRLTQGDTANVNTIIGTESNLPDGETPYHAAEGMIMYNTGDSSFYMRMNGWWHKIMSADQVNAQYFKLGGNTISTSSTYLGLTGHVDSLRIGTDSTLASIVIMPNGVIKMLDSLNAVLARVNKLYSGVASIDTLTVNDTLSVAGKLLVRSDSSKVLNVFVMQDSVVMTNLMNAYGADTALLSISPNGTVHKMSIDSLLGHNKPTINGINSTIFHLKFGTDSTRHGPWIDSTSMAADSILIFNIPDASIHARGLVDTTTQAFAGSKSFADSVAVGTTALPTSTFQVVGSVGLADTTTTASISMLLGVGTNFRTIICNVSGGAPITVTLPTSVDGRIYTFKKTGTAGQNQITVPVTITAQAGQLIDGDTLNFIMYNNWTSVTLQSQSGGWTIIGH